MQTLDQLNQELETAITLAEQAGLQEFAKKLTEAKNRVQIERVAIRD